MDRRRIPVNVNNINFNIQVGNQEPELAAASTRRKT
jgi:hypothetical protein